jgi:hypothetical protein
MRTLTCRLGHHARTAWLVLVAVTVLAVVAAVTLVLAAGGGRGGVVAAVLTGVVAFAVLAAFLDAILVPGNPDVLRSAGHSAGWSGAAAGGGGLGGHGGGDSCG